MSTITESVRIAAPKSPGAWRRIAKNLWVGAKKVAKRAGSRVKSAAKTGWRAFLGLLFQAPEIARRTVRVVQAVAWFGVAAVLSLVLGVTLFVFGVAYQVYFTLKWLIGTRAKISLREYADKSEAAAFWTTFTDLPVGHYGMGYDHDLDWQGFLRGAAEAEKQGHLMPSGEFIEEGHVDAEEIDAQPLSMAEQFQVALEYGRKLPVPVPEGAVATAAELLVVYEAAAEYAKQAGNAQDYAYWTARAATRASDDPADAKKTVAMLYRQSRDFWHTASATEGLKDETKLISHKVAA